jgi:hypothetical protein
MVLVMKVRKNIPRPFFFARSILRMKKKSLILTQISLFTANAPFPASFEQKFHKLGKKRKIWGVIVDESGSERGPCALRSAGKHDTMNLRRMKEEKGADPG